MIKEMRFYPLEQHEGTYASAKKAAEAFIQREVLTSHDVSVLSKEIAQNISHAIETAPKEHQKDLVLLLEVLTTDKILEALRGHKTFSVDYKKVPQPKYEGDRERYLEQDVERASMNAAYRRQGVLTVRYNGEGNKEEVVDLTLKELDGYLQPLRRAILEEVKNIVSSSTIHAIDTFFDKNGRIAKLSGEKVLKRALDWRRTTDPVGSEVKEARHNALKILFDLPERSPYLTYHIEGSDFRTEPREGLELQKELPITTLDVYMQTDPPPHLSDCIRYVTDAMRGAMFLIDHGLRLTDLAPHNIAIDQTSRHGQLFDYDSLFTENFVLEGYFAHSGFFPPERHAKKERQRLDGSVYFRGIVPARGAVTEAEMAYEFGVTLKKIYTHCKTVVPKIVHDMLAQNPKDRPQLKDVINALDATA